MADQRPANWHQAKIDRELAGIYESVMTARLEIKRCLDSCHNYIGERTQWVGRRREWPTKDADAERALRAQLVSPVMEVVAGRVRPWNIDNARRTLARLEAARAAIRALEEQAKPLDAIYEQEHWSRFFLVTSSQGHIHSSMRCSTCHITTTYAWLPDLSGLTEADAVAAHGPRLCSVCFASAPVEWQAGHGVSLRKVPTKGR